jgi:aldehyde:ferredoxin oxidoreductase
MDKYNTFLDEYYQLHGWGTDGIPTKDSINKLEISEAEVE